MKNKFHPYHMISISPWPIVNSFILLSMTMMTTISFLKKNLSLNLVFSLMLIMLSAMWWKSVLKESSNQGFHQLMVMEGLKMGMILFIVSEVLFFTSFFWAYFHSGISPTIELGQYWPPKLVSSFNPMNVPLLNTTILLSSGVTITWAHHAIMKNNLFQTNYMMILTCMLGLYFTALQKMEYEQAPFSISDSIYGTSFYMATGFHGIHVIIGTTFLIICSFRIYKMQMNSNHLIGMEMAAWYWHFVDVVWLFLYMSIYWWGY